MRGINKLLTEELNLREDQGCIIFNVLHATHSDDDYPDYPKISIALGSEEPVAICKNTEPFENGTRLAVRDYGDKLSSLGCPIVTDLAENWIAIGRINITEMDKGQEYTTELILCLSAKLTKKKPICNIGMLIQPGGFTIISMAPIDDEYMDYSKWEYAPHARKEDIEASAKKGVHYIWPTGATKNENYTGVVFGEAIQLYATSRDMVPAGPLQLD